MNSLLAKINKIGKDKIIIMALAGIVLIACSNFENNTESEKVKPKNGIYSFDSQAEQNQSGYIEQMETKLQEMIERMSGVDECKVMITVKADEKYNLSMTNNNSTPKIEGVLVLIKGTKDPKLSLKINNIIQALFDVKMHKISIVEMK